MTAKPCELYAVRVGRAAAYKAFFPSDENSRRTRYRHAREICAECPPDVRRECLDREFAEAKNVSAIQGFRAGMTPRERKKIYRLHQELST